ncbi:hypothetical protein RQ832_05815, partial [Roseomonas sp. DSM 102946]|nr:hypothetical protein [Roseomonas sp. DSM 102946]
DQPSQRPDRPHPARRGDSLKTLFKADYRDPDMARGSYLCGVGFLQSLAPGVNVYRTTVR